MIRSGTATIWELFRSGRLAAARSKVNVALNETGASDDLLLCAAALQIAMELGDRVLASRIKADTAWTSALQVGDDEIAAFGAAYARLLDRDGNQTLRSDVLARALRPAASLPFIVDALLEAASSDHPALRELARTLAERAATATAADPLPAAVSAHVEAITDRLSGHNASAVLHAAKARIAYERVGWTLYAQRVQRIGSSGEHGGLSSREQEVAMLAARGATNRGIGEELHLSEKTIEKHVASIYQKLGISKRVQLVEKLAAVSPRVLDHALPSPLTPFIGRAAEMATVTERLATQRLVTILGPGGTGKTRLALEAARSQRDRFANGAYWIDLSAVYGEEGIYPTIAAACEIKRDGRPLAQAVLEALARLDALIVLDNCEQLVPALSGIVRDLLGAAPQLRLLTTSRQRLAIFGESVVRLAQMALPEAAAFLRERAASAGAIADNAQSIEQLCVRLDCVPLAIELAAGRLHQVPLEAIIRELETGQSALQTSDIGIVERHRSIDALIGWAYDSLDEEQRAAFRSLSTLADSCSGACATALCGTRAAVALEALCRVCLIERLPSGRYGMLQVVRDVAARLLHERGEEGDAFARLAQFFTRMLEDADRHWYTTPVPLWIETLSVEGKNILRVLRWTLIEGNAPADGVAVTVSAAKLWGELAREQEFDLYLNAALAHEERAPVRTRALLWLERARSDEVAGFSADSERHALLARSFAEQSGGESIIAQCDLVVGGALATQRKTDAARPYVERAKAYFAAHGMHRLTQSALISLSNTAPRGSDEQIGLLLEALELCRTLDNPLVEAVILNNLGAAHRERGRSIEAIEYVRGSAAILRSLGAQTRLARALLNLSGCERDAGHYDAAIANGLEGFGILCAIAPGRLMQEIIEELAPLYSASHPAFSAKLVGAGSAIARSRGGESPLQTLEANLRASLGDDAFASLAAAGAIAEPQALHDEARRFAWV